MSIVLKAESDMGFLKYGKDKGVHIRIWQLHLHNVNIVSKDPGLDAAPRF